MKDKAAANLMASRTLLAADLIDPAMNRLYYALFQAGVHGMEKQGKTPEDFTKGETKWRHEWVCDNAILYRKCSADRPMFRRAYSLRERADYRKQRVLRAEVDGLLPGADAFVKEVCS